MLAGLICTGIGLLILVIASLICIAINNGPTSFALCYGCARRVPSNALLCPDCKGLYDEHSVPIRPL